MNKQEEIIKLALDRFKKCVDAEADNRALALKDLKFFYGEQWEEGIKSERAADRRPCLTKNRTRTFVKQVVNDIRQVRPAIKTRPVDSVGDPETAEIMNGMIRAIEKSCNAETAYDWAAEYAVIMGWGYFRITTDWCDDSFEQDIVIKRINNPFSVYLDADRAEPDGSDARYCFVTDDMSKREFEAEYPDAESEWGEQGIGDYGEDWFTEDSVRVAEYWTVKVEKETLSLMEDETILVGNIEGAKKTRDRENRSLIQRLITGKEILSETEYDWKYIPIIPVLGEELNIEGKTLLKGMVRDMIDPQKQYNYMSSAEVERVALAPLSPWTGPTGSFKNPKWRNANQKSYAFLEWDTKAVMDAGGLAPRREPPPDVSPGLANSINQTVEELKAITGIYDPSLGDRSNEVSGIAIKARKVQSNITNFNFVDNVARAMGHGGRVILDILPKTMKTARMFNILKPDGSEESIQINKEYVDEKGKDRNYDITAGKYDVVVDVGPSYATQREEAVASMLEMVKAFPGAMQVMGDLLAKNMDWPESDEIAKRLKLLLPPEIAADENPQIKAIQQQYEQMLKKGGEYIEYLESQLQAMAQQLDSKDGELAIKEGELARKYKEMAQNFVTDMTKMELEYQKNVPGSQI